MESIESWKRKARKGRLICLLCIAIIIIVDLICILIITSGKYKDKWIFFVVYYPSLLFVVTALALMIAQFKVVYRLYNGSCIIVYKGLIKGYLIIDNQIQCVGGAFQHDLYGQLPDGTNVQAKFSYWSENIKIAVGDFDNMNIHFW